MRLHTINGWAYITSYTLSHRLYFVGYGVPIALATAFTSRGLLSMGIFQFLFPIVSEKF